MVAAGKPFRWCRRPLPPQRALGGARGSVRAARARGMEVASCGDGPFLPPSRWSMTGRPPCGAAPPTSGVVVRRLLWLPWPAALACETLGGAGCPCPSCRLRGGSQWCPSSPPPFLSPASPIRTPPWLGQCASARWHGQPSAAARRGCRLPLGARRRSCTGRLRRSACALTRRRCGCASARWGCLAVGGDGHGCCCRRGERPVDRATLKRSPVGVAGTREGRLPPTTDGRV